MKKNIKFILNYSDDARDIPTIENCDDKIMIANEFCSSVRVNEGSICFSKLDNLSVDEIKREKYRFEDRKRFYNDELSLGDIGVLKERTGSINRLYIIEITEILKSDGKIIPISKKNKLVSEEKIKYIESFCSNSFRYIKFKVLYKATDNDKGVSLKGIKANWQSTLTIIRKENVIESFENMEWKKYN